MSPRHRIWRDGALVRWEDATIHVLSHVVHYGSSVFEGLRCYETPSGPAIFRLGDHMRRFLDSARVYRMEPAHGLDELCAGCMEVVAANGLRECYIRPVAIRSGEQMAVHGVGAPVETFIIPWEWGRYLGDEGVRSGVDVCVSSWRRPAPGTLPTMAKAGGNYLVSQLGMMEAQVNGYAEAIMLDYFGNAAEGTGENLFVVRDGVLITPPAGASILPGLTRDSVIRIARHLGLEVLEQHIPRELLHVADEVFLTGTAAEVTPVRSVDRIPVGSGTTGPITQSIQSEYLGIVRGALPDRWGWLTHVPVSEPLAKGGRQSVDRNVTTGT